MQKLLHDNNKSFTNTLRGLITCLQVYQRPSFISNFPIANESENLEVLSYQYERFYESTIRLVANCVVTLSLSVLIRDRVSARVYLVTDSNGCICCILVDVD